MAGGAEACRDQDQVPPSAGMLLVAILLIGGPVIAVLGAILAVSSLLLRRMYFAALGVTAALAGILCAGWLVYQQFLR